VLGVQGVVLLPTRELALQAFTFFKTYATFKALLRIF
jgi:superfamily II DNA/RNA helicase